MAKRTNDDDDELASDDEPVAVSSDDERPAPKKKPVKKEKAAPSSSKAKPKAKETTSKKASKEKPAPKKARKSTDRVLGQVERDEEGNSYVEIGSNRRVTVSEYKGATQIHIREYYDADGIMKPGKKGVALTVDQWKVLGDCIEAVDKLIEDK